MPLRVSVIIPTLNESRIIQQTLKRLAGQGVDEVIVVDAGSSDATAELAKTAGARVLQSPKGRGVQQNLGASAASGDVFLFMHADCWLEAGAIETLRRFVQRCPKVPGGCFRMRVEAPDLRFRLINTAAHLRAGVLGLPYGDQGIFVSRWAFDAVLGFPELPLMEDVYLGMRLQRLGRLALLPKQIQVSPRRWQKQGILGQSIRNWALTTAAAVGVPVKQLARFYPLVR